MISAATNSPRTTFIATALFVPLRLKREKQELMPQHGVTIPGNTASNPGKMETSEDSNRNTNATPVPLNTGSAPPTSPIPMIVSSLSSNGTSSTSATLSNEKNNDAVPDPFVRCHRRRLSPVLL